MTILIVTSLTHRALDQESLVVAWLKKGYRVIVLNFFNKNPFQIPGTFHDYKLISFDARPGKFGLARTALKIVRLCWRHNVNSIIAHLEYPSFVSVVANFFIRSKVIVYRHHADYALLNGFDKSFSYKFTYRFAPVVIVVSNHAKKIMVEKENVSPNKIKVIPLAFDFKLFPIPVKAETQAIRKKYNASLVLLAIGRLTRLKRPYHSIDVLKRLLNNGVDAKLILLGVGEEQGPLEQYILENKLQQNVFVLGFSSEPLTYMHAADFILHPSISESSSIIVKEAGIVKKPCIICRGVGDFDEYVIHYKNGFQVDQNNFVEESVNIINSVRQDKKLLYEIGENLHNDILRLFDVNHVIKEYDILFKG